MHAQFVKWSSSPLYKNCIPRVSIKWGSKNRYKIMHFYEFGQLYGLSYPVYGGLGHLGNWAGARLCLIRSEIFLPFYDGSRIF
jgi:hypothetical protein